MSEEKSDNAWSVAYSPCPNDTFVFCEVAQRPEMTVALHDIETLNRLAFEGTYDVTKLSFHAWLLLRDQYQLLRVGAALGRGCGPLVIRRRGTTEELTRKSIVAIPGELTTAHLLFKLWNPEVEKRVFMPFNQIMDALAAGEVDAGVIIHEGRFVFEERGFALTVDLGDWWEHKTGLPIPLGCMAAKKSLGAERIAEFEALLEHSIRAAFNDPEATRAYVKLHAQELNDDVIDQHIKTYVNDFTLDLGPEGQAAIDAFATFTDQKA